MQFTIYKHATQQQHNTQIQIQIKYKYKSNTNTNTNTNTNNTNTNTKQIIQIQIKTYLFNLSFITYPFRPWKFLKMTYFLQTVLGLYQHIRVCYNEHTHIAMICDLPGSYKP